MLQKQRCRSNSALCAADFDHCLSFSICKNRFSEDVALMIDNI